MDILAIVVLFAHSFPVGGGRGRTSHSGELDKTGAIVLVRFVVCLLDCGGHGREGAWVQVVLLGLHHMADLKSSPSLYCLAPSLPRSVGNP